MEEENQFPEFIVDILSEKYKEIKEKDQEKSKIEAGSGNSEKTINTPQESDPQKNLVCSTKNSFTEPPLDETRQL